MQESLLKVTENDCYLLNEWANEETVRQNAFNTDKINYEEHCKWFYSKLKADNTFMYIYYIENIPIGQIRIEINGDVGIIDYSIDKSYRNKGYGKKILKAVENEVENQKINLNKLIAQVKYKNIHSQKCFNSLNYLKKEKKKYIEYYKKF